MITDTEWLHIALDVLAPVVVFAVARSRGPLTTFILAPLAIQTGVLLAVTAIIAVPPHRPLPVYSAITAVGYFVVLGTITALAIWLSGEAHQEALSLA